MGQFIKTQNSFALGEVSEQFYTRDDINGLARLENMDVLSSGCLTRRSIKTNYIKTWQVLGHIKMQNYYSMPSALAR